jgi:extracellular factor (EF) 3-hydroxypalmitic acid methyl ester biosynthesis protein
MTRNPLEFLTTEDMDLLEEKAEHLHFKKNELILQEGSRRQAIFVVRQGTVRVERTHSGKAVPYARLGPKEIFGEMSFVENEAASATVLAEGDVELDLIEGHHVHGLMASVPGFGTRFYQSLALTLSHRLRSTSGLIVPLMVEEAPTVKRPRGVPDDRVRHGELPSELFSSLQEFRRGMLKIDRAIKNHDLKAAEARSLVGETCDRIIKALSGLVKSFPDAARVIGGYVFRETLPFFMLSKRFDRVYTKPRGYAIDFLTIDLLCTGQPEGAGRLGAFIDAWFMDLPLAKAFKRRREIVAETARNVARELSHLPSIAVAALSDGSSRELLEVCAGQDFSLMRCVCIDMDSEALASAAGIAEELHLSGRFTAMKENVMRLALGKGVLAVEPFQMICTTSLPDYIEDDFLVKLLDWIFEHLASGGTAVMANFAPSNPDLPFMEHILDWPLIHRSGDTLQKLVAQSRFSSSQVNIKSDDTHTQILAFCRKP